jgi:alanine dehydrogenase
VLDNNLDRLRAFDRSYGAGRVRTLASTAQEIEAACLRADLVIGTVLVAGALAPRLVSDELVRRMKPGAALIDVSIDQGGCIEGSTPTVHSNPMFRRHDCVFYCVANMPGAVPFTSTYALTNATLGYVDALAGSGLRGAVREHPSLAHGLMTVDGVLTSEPVAGAHHLPWERGVDVLAA